MNFHGIDIDEGSDIIVNVRRADGSMEAVKVSGEDVIRDASIRKARRLRKGIGLAAWLAVTTSVTCWTAFVVAENPDSRRIATRIELAVAEVLGHRNDAYVAIADANNKLDAQNIALREAVGRLAKEVDQLADARRDAEGERDATLLAAREAIRIIEADLVEIANGLGGIHPAVDGMPLPDEGVTGDICTAVGDLRRLGAVPVGTPTEELRISSEFGVRNHPVLGKHKMHEGIDFVLERGTPVFATASGKVLFADWKGGYGKVIEMEYKGGFGTLYAHLSKIAVEEGQKVKAGEVIGYSGNTGRSTGPHLHYEVHFKGEPLNPKPFIEVVPSIGAGIESVIETTDQIGPPELDRVASAGGD